VFQARKRVLAKKTATGAVRYWKNIGLGFRTPKEAIDGTYVDKKCPFTSSVSIRGRILKGYIHSAKMARTVIIRRDYLHYIRKYNRYEKRHTNLAAHCSPAFRVKEGDSVTVGECRPLSKTVRFNVLCSGGWARKGSREVRMRHLHARC
jgi:small subunit ribosomal protein S11e